MPDLEGMVASSEDDASPHEGADRYGGVEFVSPLRSDDLLAARRRSGAALAGQAALALGVVSVAVLAIVHGGDGGQPQQEVLGESWAGWMAGIEGGMGIGAATTDAHARARPALQAGSLPTTMHLADRRGARSLHLATGSALKAWVATGVENFARACGRDRDEPCPAGQSTTEHGGVAARAVDNGNQTSYSGGTCTHTQTQSGPWWKVNFGRQIKVTGVRVFGRSDCCSDRLQGFDVWVGNHNYQPDANAACATNQDAPAADSYIDVTCASPLTGTYLFVSIPGDDKILTLCEVLVHGEELPPDQGGYDPWGIANAVNPRPDQLPLGASRNTWANIVANKKNVLWCSENFRYLGSRMRCIHSFTGGPLLMKDAAREALLAPPAALGAAQAQAKLSHAAPTQALVAGLLQGRKRAEGPR